MGNTPNVRFKGFTEDWEQRKLGELYQRNTERNENLIGYDKTISVATMSYKDDGNGASESSLSTYKVLRVGDIAFEGHTNKQFRFGRFVVNDIGTGIMSPRFSTLRPLNEMPVNFWKQYIHSEAVMRRILVNSTKAGTMMNELVIPEFLNQTIMVPSENEQAVIGQYFTNLDHLITLHQQKCDETKEFKKYMLQNMFPQKDEKVPKIRFAGFTGDWEQRKLGDVAEYRNGKAHENEIDDDGEYIVVNSKFVSTNGEIKKFSNAQNEPLYENEIAFVLSDVPNGRAIARTFLIEKSGKYTLNQRIAGITPHEDTDPYYLHIKMNRNAYFLKFDDGNKQTNLSIKDVLNYEDMYPNYKEQQKIGNYFRSLDHLITLHQQKCAVLKEFKKYMLQNMFPQKGENKCQN